MAKSNRNQQKKDQREALILRSAANLFHLHGFAGVTMDTLAAEADITKPTLYNHFASKDAIVERLLLLGLQQVNGYLEASAHIAFQRDRLVFILRCMMLAGLDDPLPLVGLHDAVARAAADRLEGARQLSTQIDTTLSDIILDGQAKNEIIRELDPSAIISVMFALMQAVNARVAQNTPPDQVRELSRLFELVFVRGISV